MLYIDENSSREDLMKALSSDSNLMDWMTQRHSWADIENLSTIELYETIQDWIIEGDETYKI